MRKHLFLLILIALIPLLCYSQTYSLEDRWVDCGNECQLLDPYYNEGVTFKWDGPSNNGKADGYGTAIKYVNGEYESTYIGEYKNGIRSGKGQFTHKDGSIKSGTFVNGQLIGYGTMQSENGDTYEGYFINYRCHGKGKVTWGNGASFEGYMVTDSPYTGKYTNYDGTITYIFQGEIVDKIIEKKSNYSPKVGIRQREYFDEEWKRCQAKEAVFYRLITYDAPNIPKGKVRDYYITGELQGEAAFIYVDYDDEGKNFTEGDILLYYKNGRIKEKVTYLNNKPNGVYTEYYESGSKKTEHFFKNGVNHGLLNNYREDGTLAISAAYDNGKLKNNKYLRFEEDGTCFLVYNEDFARNSIAWEYNGQNGIVSIYNKESVVLSPSIGRTVTAGVDTGLNCENENVIEFTVTQNSAPNSSVGIIFGFKDWNNYCSLYLSSNSYYFRYIKDGKQMTNEEWESSKAIKPDVNQITIANTSTRLIIDINDDIVWESQPINYRGSFCGVTADNNSEAEVYAAILGLSVYEVVTNEAILREYTPSTRKKSENNWKSSGSGFFITPNGYIATNYHVVENASQIEISFIRNGEWEHHPAKIVLSDKQNDLSILRIQGNSFKQLGNIPYNFTTNIKDTGSEVFTLGYPIANIMGDEVKFTDGKISSKTGIQGDVTVYQISVPIQPGNSGGPLFDNHGNVVGITSSGLDRDYFKSENVNYAIKSLYLKSLIDSMTQQIELQTSAPVSEKPLTEKIKLFQGFMTYIKVK